MQHVFHRLSTRSGLSSLRRVTSSRHIDFTFKAPISWATQTSSYRHHRATIMADSSSNIENSARDDRSTKGKGGQKGRDGKRGKPSGSTKLRGLEKDSPEVRTSKTLSWLLRHGAASEGLGIRADGYVEVEELLRHPRLRATSLDMDGLRKIVAADAKKRYDLKFEPESSSPTETSGQSSAHGIWWIKANQGHSLKTVHLDLKPISSLDDIPTGIAVHGTTTAAWKTIEKEGLSKMKRNHIHLAQAVSTTEAISGLRKSAQILVYIDIPRAMAEGIKFFLSDNGVVLTEGDGNGFLKPDLFLRVESTNGQALPGWEGPGPIQPKRIDSSVPTGQPKGGEGSSTPRDSVTQAETAMENLTVTETAEKK